MRRCLWVISALVFCTTIGLQAQEFLVQSVTGASEQSLDTSKTHTWWVTDKQVNPAAFTKALLDARRDLAGAADPFPAGWVPAGVPGPVAATKGFPKDALHAWYAKTFYLDAAAVPPLAVEFGYIDDADVCYVNGVRVGSSGQIGGTSASAYDKERIYEIPESLLRRNGTNVILLQVRGVFPGTWGFWQGRTEIGQSRVLISKFYRRAFAELLFLVSYFTVGSYFLFLFVRRRAEIENLLFGIFTYVLVAYTLLKSQLRFEMGLDFLVGKRLEYLFLYAAVPCFYLFIRFYYKFKRTLWMRIWDLVAATACAGLAACALSVLISTDALFWWNVQSYIGQPLWVPLMLQVLGILIVHARRADRDAYYMLGGFAALIACMGIDIASNRGLINLPTLMTYVFLAFVLSLALVLANRFVRLHTEIEDLNATLERRVVERTNQLRESLTEVQALKEQQDGDYFLTSLLLSPLSGLHAKSDLVSLEFYVRQKKTFSFKRWNASIGGDICIAHSIILRGRRCIVFLNGDAMGKSIQGAGGALVLGTVFKAMVTRTHMRESAQDRYPEQWLKECFHELQNVFVAFDGSMLISAVMGIIDEQKGAMYYVNAEHPQPVIYREGRASFIGESAPLHKIGVDWNTKRSLHICVFQLLPDDIVVVGSDGRDDLELGSDVRGNRIINEDETLFLRAVEAAEGNLRRLEEELLRAGNLTDDLSLIRIGFKEDAAAVERKELPELGALVRDAKASKERGNHEEARLKFASILERYPGSPAALRSIIRLDMFTGRYMEAARNAERYLELRPLETDYLYLASTAYKAAGRNSRDQRLLTAAADVGERCRIRNPDHVNNLINLADIYRLMGNAQRARQMLDEAEVQSPGDDTVLQIRRLVSG